MAILGIPSTSIVDSTSVGRSLITASDAAAARVIMELAAVDDVTFNSVSSVGGSFTGNLDTEVGGSQRVYNLGADGDTDTEYLETSFDNDIAVIGTVNSGAGSVRSLQIKRGTQPMIYFGSETGGSIWIQRPIRASAAYNIGLSYERFNAGYFNTLDAAILVKSVDGDFSGDVIMAANVDFTGLPTSDPVVAGRLWNHNDTVKISAG